MIPYTGGKLTLFDAGGQSLGNLSDKPTEAKTIVIDRQGFGVRIELAKPLRVVQGANKTILVEFVAPGGDQLTPAEEVALTYRLLPYVGKP